MNVLLVTSLRIAGTAGIGRIIRSLQQSLKKEGHKALILMHGDSNTIEPVQAVVWEDSYEIYLRDMSPAIKRAKRFLGFCFYLPYSLYCLIRFLKLKGIDVVHIQYPTASLFYFALLRPFARWKLVVSLQGSDINNMAEQDWCSRRLVKFLFARADLITACAKSLLDKLGIISEKCLVKSVLIPNANPYEGVPVDYRQPANGIPEQFILSVGSLIYRKGHDILLRAVRSARDKGCRLNLVIVGGGPEATTITSLAQELEISDQLSVRGELAHEALAAYYEKCRFFALATRAEGMPLVVLEAMSFQKAVVASSVDGIAEIVTDGDNGLLVPPEDVETLADALVRLDRDDGLREGLARRAQAFVLGEHTWEHFTNRNIEAYRAVLNHGGSCSR